jgi:hypothetical protein
LVPKIGEKRAKLIAFLVLCSLLASLQNIEAVMAVEDSWTTMEPMPTARSGLGVAAVDGKIYAIGGSNGNSQLDTNEMYDPATNTWVSKQPMSTARSRFGITVFENKIYVMGGANSSSFTDANEVYDPATDTWTTKTEMPTAVYSCTSAVVDNKIYLLENGRSVTIPCLNQIYDTETDTWGIGQPIPTRAVGAAAVAATGVYAPKRIYVIGGGDLLTYDLNQIYDLETDTWTNGTAMPTPRQRLGAVALNDTLYAIGGYQIDSDACVSKNERYTPSDYIPEFPSWKPLLITSIAVVAVAVIYKRNLSKANQRRVDQ